MFGGQDFRRRGWLRLIAGGLILLLFAQARAQTERSPTQDCIDQLRKAVEIQRDGSHLIGLLALRHLKDPALIPLFERLTDHPQWQVQVHATLALAELSDQGLSLDLITPLQQAARERIIAEAIDQDLLTPEQMHAILAWPQLEELPRLLLLAELFHIGEEIDRTQLEGLVAEHVNTRIAGIATALLAQLGDAAAMSTYRQRLASLPNERARADLLLSVFDAIRQYRLTALTSWVSTEIERPEADPNVVYWGIFTLLCIDPTSGLTAWKAHRGADPGYGTEIRFALLLIRAHPHLPPQSFDLITSDDPLLQAMAKAGRAVASGAPATRELIDLVSFDHQSSADWVMSVAEEMPASEVRQLYEHILDHLKEDEPRGLSERRARAVESTGRLFRIAPDAMLERLAQAPDDSELQQVLIMGLFDAESPRVGEAAAKIERIGIGRADCLALMLVARHAASLSDADLRTLARIAGGGVRLAAAMPTQAAWIYLRLTGQTEQAYRQLFPPDRP